MSNSVATLNAAASLPERLTRLARPASVVLLALVVFVPALDNEFVGWDDPDWVGANPFILDAAGLKEVWTSIHTASYYSCPVTVTSFWLEYRLWGLDARGYHLTNVLLHGLNALLVWWVLRALGAGRWPSWLAAALFAVHPMQVQSVAWVTERKNVLSLALMLGSFLFYVRHRRTGGWWTYACSVLLFTGAVLSKASAVILPAILLWTEWAVGLPAARGWGRLNRAALFRTVPMLVVAAGITALTVYMEHPSAPDGPPGMSRLLVAGAIPWFYLAKLMAPVGLMPLYPKWELATEALVWWLPLAALVVAAVTLLVYRRKLNRFFLWGLGMFLLSLLPMSGLAHYVFFDYSYVSNHYIYMACIGVFLSLGVLLERLYGPVLVRPAARAATMLVVLAAVGGLAAQTWRRCDLWQDTKTILHEVLRYYPDFWMAHASLGDVVAQEGDYRQAVAYYRRSLELNPDQSLVRHNLGSLLATLGDNAAAVESYRRAIALQPDALPPRINLGALLLRLRRFPEAVELYQSVLNLKADDPTVLTNLGYALAELGRPLEAIESLEKATHIAADLPQAHFSLAFTYQSIGRSEEAAQGYRRCIELDPRHAGARHQLGNLLAQQGQLKQALQQYRRALETEPDRLEIVFYLGDILFQLGRYAEAAEALERAHQLRPEHLGTVSRLALLLATSPHPEHRDGRRALRLARRVCQATQYRSSQALDLLACAQAEVGQFEEARAGVRRALQLAEQDDRREWIEEFQRHLRAFRADRPFRQPLLSPVEQPD